MRKRKMTSLSQMFAVNAQETAEEYGNKALIPDPHTTTATQENEYETGDLNNDDEQEFDSVDEEFQGPRLLNYLQQNSI